MKCVLFVGIDPRHDTASMSGQDWPNFAGRAKGIAAASPKSVTMLNPGTYLLRLDDGLHSLLNLSRIADTENIEFRTLFFEEEPSWLSTKPSPRG